jgi:hypothetical protein
MYCRDKYFRANYGPIRGFAMGYNPTMNYMGGSGLH